MKVLLAGTAMAALAAVPALAQAGSGAADANEVVVPITGPDLTRASEVAIEHLGGGTVTETEIEDEENYYEVEVTLDDGRQVDVQLDEGFNVVGTEDDGTGTDD
jgi:uncharacterized membrane protein YkoI